MSNNSTNLSTSILALEQGLTRTELNVFLVFSVFLVGVVIFNNLLVILAAYSNPRLRRSTYSIFVSLAVSDFLVGAVSMPLWIYMMATSARMPQGVYVFYIVFDIFSAIASILHLASVSIERYLAVSKPAKHRLTSQQPYRNTLAAVWIFAAFIACLYPLQKTFNWLAIYTILVFSLGFFIPLLIISSMYIKIFRISTKIIAPLERRTSKEDLKRHFRKEHQLARTGALVTGLFFITWIPFFTVSLIGTFCRLCLQPIPGFDWKLTAFVKFMHYGNSAMNTCVYAFLNTEMKRTFVRLFKAVTPKVCPMSLLHSIERTRRWRNIRKHMKPPAQRPGPAIFVN